ncbi:uncharacterized protein LOC119183586 isoform X2 [Rhipicephalus microplus]|uniref:uncharacterized protein LOC119183586 isoform X2 n=1 Tax=Rhipicephalus microplus TaxID=6941 RepID=UPI003F6D343A
MKPLGLILFCVGCFYNAQATMSKKLYISPRESRWSHWRDALEADPKHRPYIPNGTIGKGVLLTAVALYDSNFYNFTKITEEPNEPNSVTNTDHIGKPVEQYFKEFFQKVQDYFNNRSIMININVEKVTQMDNLTVYFEDTHVVDGRRTLENITTYGDGLAQANNTIFYLFTWPPDEGNSRRLFHEINTVPPHRTSISEIATNGTFCSNSTSAAFVRHKYNNYNIWSTVKATLTTFGSPHFIFFTEEDYHKMNETFINPLQTINHNKSITDLYARKATD